MSNVLDINDNKCTSCQVCAAVCPANAVKINLNENGFYRPEIDAEKCVSCGKCKKVCYKFDDNVLMADECMGVYACKSDASVLNDVTSGGIAYLLAKKAITEGYRVVGVTYDTERNIAITEIADTNIEQFKGSKYIQAYTIDAFKGILKDKTNSKYMVFGLPCHIYALKKAVGLNKNEKDFVFVDLFCHGCPSMLLWNKSLKKAQEKLGTDTFEKVEFRSKKKGWHEFCLNFETADKRTFISDGFGPFYSLFFSNLVLNDACRDCKLRSTLEYTDIRLGDFWGWQYDEDVTGVSAVTAVSKTGAEWLKKLPENVFVAEHSLKDVVKGQSYGKIYAVDAEKRAEIIDLLKSEIPIDEVQKIFKSKLSMKSKIKNIIKRIVYMMPQSVRIIVRKRFHQN